MTEAAGQGPFAGRRKEREGLFDDGSLWIMVAVPSIWAAHFLLCYWVAAVWCAKVGSDFAVVRWTVAGLSVAALAGIGLLGWYARRRYAGEFVVEEDLTNDSDSDRKRFLGHATMLLVALSAVAVVFDALPALVLEACR